MTTGTRRSEVSLARARSRGLLSSALLFSVFSNLLVLTGPLFMLQVYDRVLGSRSEETLVALFVLVAALYAFYGLLEFARGRVMARVGARFHAAVNDRVFTAVLEQQSLGGGRPASSAIADLDFVRTLFNSPALLAFFDLPWTPIFALAIFVFHPMLGWVAVFGGAVLIAVTLANQAVTARRAAQTRQSAQSVQRFERQVEAASGLVRAQGMAPAMTERWNLLQSGAVAQSLAIADWTGSFAAFSKAFRFLLQSTVLALGAWLVLQQEITAGVMIAASILLGRALAPVEQVIGQWAILQRARTGWRGLEKLLHEHPAPPALVDLPVPAARFSLRGVSVVMRRGDPPVLQNIGFDLEPGQALGIIGKSGSGKTTLARVLVGLIRPNVGQVRLDRATLDQYGPDTLGQHIGYLPQEVVLFDGTIAENVAQMALSPDAEKVVAAARKARVHDIIVTLPDGYNTRIAVGDGILSGGQRQRLALARALYNDPVLLVLDEPNSALDAEGSDALTGVISDMKASGGAVILMTHRPTAISACDQILVLDCGRVASYGPRDKVIKSALRNASEVQRTLAQGGGA